MKGDEGEERAATYVALPKLWERTMALAEPQLPPPGALSLGWWVGRQDGKTQQR